MPSREVFQYIAEKSGEKIAEFFLCRWCGEEYPVFHKEQVFLQKQGFSVSDLCFDCRLRSMFLWRNERKLYWRKSDKSGKKILSMFHPEYTGKVYDYDEWDREEGFGHMGKPVDGDVLTSYYELLQEIPKSGTDIFRSNENIWYCNRAGYLKNAYYSFACFQDNEDIYFSYVSTGSKDIYNSSNTYGSQLVAESVQVFDSYGVFFSDEIVNSKYIWFSYDMRDCEECIFCHNQVGKKYMIQNTQYPKEQYESMKAELQKQMSTSTGRKELEKRYELLKQQSIKKALNHINAEKAYGDGLQDSKDVIYGFGLQ
ncbi:MAG: hypothetical protein H6767_04980 [Candidatus Peribacteria bacterium]|nr:MAG: hypothetical protein H6767_04980 [Candidatus Peribacteria bacterium]